MPKRLEEESRGVQSVEVGLPCQYYEPRRTLSIAIIGFSDLITDRYDAKRGVHRIVTLNNELLLQLIDDILDLSRR